MSILVHGGNLKDISGNCGTDIKNLKDFSSNINPLGPPEGLLEYLNSNVNDLLLLPEYDSASCTGFISGLLGIDRERVVAGNGTTEFIHRLPEVLRPEKVLIIGPTYSDYEKACAIRNICSDYLFLDKESDFRADYNEIRKRIRDYDLVFICNPNNPTGYIFERDQLKSLAWEFPETNFIIDETYLPFENDFFTRSMAGEDIDNIYVLLSFSKIFALPGLRLGFMALPSKKDKKIFDLPWKVNSVSSGVCSFMNDNPDKLEEFLKKTWSFLRNEKDIFFSEKVINENLKLVNSNNIYTLAEINFTDHDSSSMFDYFLKRFIVIRDCSNIKGLGSSFIRFSLRNSDDNNLLLKELKKVFEG